MGFWNFLKKDKNKRTKRIIPTCEFIPNVDVMLKQVAEETDKEKSEKIPSHLDVDFFPAWDWEKTDEQMTQELQRRNSVLMKAMLSSPFPTGPQFMSFDQMEKMNQTTSKGE